MKRLVAALAVFSLVAVLGMVFVVQSRLRAHSHAEGFTHQGALQPLEPLWPVPDFTFRDHSGAPVSRASLLGTPWVANFIFTSCRTVCPLLTTKMVRLQRELTGVPVGFVSFSVDPGHDTHEVLEAYRSVWNPEETRWRLVETTEEGLPSLARGFRVTAQRSDAGEDPILHSSLFVLADAQGQVVGVFDLEDSADFQGLLAAVRTLVGGNAAKPPSPSPERSGEALYRELSCAQCHDDPSLAPALAGLSGKRRTLDTSLEITADVSYLRESILAPDLKRVRGYPLRMPSYEGHLSPKELENLITYLGTLTSAPGAAGQEVTLDRVAVDPICHMEVRVTSDALHVGDTYFCSESCRKRYLEKAKPALPER